MTICFEHLTDPTPGDLARVRAIYEANFPPIMQKPFRLIEEGAANGAITLLAARDAGPLIGFATIARLPAASARSSAGWRACSDWSASCSPRPPTPATFFARRT